MQDCPLPEQTEVYVMPSTSGRNVHFANDGGKAAWDALGKEMHAAFATMEWPPKPKCYPGGWADAAVLCDKS